MACHTTTPLISNRNTTKLGRGQTSQENWHAIAQAESALLYNGDSVGLMAAIDYCERIQMGVQNRETHLKPSS